MYGQPAYADQYDMTREKFILISKGVGDRNWDYILLIESVSIYERNIASNYIFDH